MKGLKMKGTVDKRALSNAEVSGVLQKKLVVNYELKLHKRCLKMALSVKERKQCVILRWEY